MGLDSVSFLFDNSELILLLRLLGCENILALLREDGVDTKAALERLRDDQLVSGSQEALAVDQVIAFLLLSMDRAGFWLCVLGDDGYAGIFKASLASIVLHKRGERWVVTPFPTFPDARISMLRYLRGIQAPCVLTIYEKDCVETLRFQTTKGVIKAMEERLPVEEKEAREKWKP